MVKILPTTWALPGLLDLMSRGGGVPEILPEAGVLGDQLKTDSSGEGWSPFGLATWGQVTGQAGLVALAAWPAWTTVHSR